MSNTSKTKVPTKTDTVVERQETLPVFTPAVDIYETHEGLVLQADLPGVTKEGLDVQVESNVLTISARTEQHPPAQSSLAHQEYVVGDYERSFILSDEIDRSKIAAELKDGVLTLTLPKSESVLPRKIAVKSE